ncbi:MAG: GIY-YIG nuclease family protein [Candidatus Moraniibacteriota bacterium]
MHFVYILQSQKDKRTYVGYTNNLKRRLAEHNNGRVQSTKNRKPFIILFTEKFLTSREAKKRELYWKSGAGRRNLNKIFQKIND